MLILMLAAVYVIVGLAVQHAAYVIQYGDIFGWLRNLLATSGWLLSRNEIGKVTNFNAEMKRPGFIAWAARVLRTLLMCQTCFITQLTFWLWSLPTSIWVWQHFNIPVPLWLYCVALVMTWLSQAAVGLFFWTVIRGTEKIVEARIQQERAKVEQKRITA